MVVDIKKLTVTVAPLAPLDLPSDPMVCLHKPHFKNRGMSTDGARGCYAAVAVNTLWAHWRLLGASLSSDLSRSIPTKGVGGTPLLSGSAYLIVYKELVILARKRGDHLRGIPGAV